MTCRYVACFAVPHGLAVAAPAVDPPAWAGDGGTVLPPPDVDAAEQPMPVTSSKAPRSARRGMNPPYDGQADDMDISALAKLYALEGPFTTIYLATPSDTEDA